MMSSGADDAATDAATAAATDDETLELMRSLARAQQHRGPDLGTPLDWVARVSSAAAATAAAERTEGAGGHEEPDEDVDEDEDEGIYAEHDTRRGRSRCVRWVRWGEAW